jgi:hypothetical protein
MMRDSISTHNPRATTERGLNTEKALILKKEKDEY